MQAKVQKGRRKSGNTFADVLIIALMIVLCVVFLYPLYMQLCLSVSTARDLVGVNNVVLYPHGFSLKSYQQLLSDPSIVRYYVNTIVYAATGTLLLLAVTSLLAYPLSVREFRGKRLINVLLLITMFFGGGLIPTYMTIRAYGMIDTLWALILPGSVSAWNVIMFVNFFQTIPDSLSESATIDGANHLQILLFIVLPLSKALLATISLFTVVGFWNGYFNALVYMNTADHMPIQIFLRKILITTEIMDSAANADPSRLLEMSNYNPRTVKAAAVIVTMAPILCVYPFVQKYFTKGMMIGAVKALSLIHIYSIV